MTNLRCKVREIRTELGISQAQMARDINMSVKDLWQIENGRNVTMTTAGFILRYLRTLNPTIDMTDIWPDLVENNIKVAQ